MSRSGSCRRSGYRLTRIPYRGEHCQTARRAAADIEGHSTAAKFGQSRRLKASVKAADSQLDTLFATRGWLRPAFARLLPYWRNDQNDPARDYSPDDERNVCCNAAADVAVGDLGEVLTSLLRGLR
jgi:hypothetical protein